MTARWRTAWITGASTGIGRELALRLAMQGVTVAASARSADKLDELTGAFANIIAVPLDVTDAAAVTAAHRRITDAIGPIDLAILNAGIWHPMKTSAYAAELATRSMNVNYNGVVHALEPLIPAMIASGKGHIALVASVAGFRGLPLSSAYAPTKAALISLAEVLRLELSRHGIVVSLVNPGFVETPMTSANTFPMPYIMPVDDAADRIMAGLERGKFEIAFPWQVVASLKLLRLLPNSLYLRLAGRMIGY